jgi:hypothetical protein
MAAATFCCGAALLRSGAATPPSRRAPVSLLPQSLPGPPLAPEGACPRVSAATGLAAAVLLRSVGRARALRLAPRPHPC